MNAASSIDSEAQGDELPVARDSHTCCQANDEMYIFGGFKGGARTNEILIYDFTEETWSTNHDIIKEEGVALIDYQ